MTEDTLKTYGVLQPALMHKFCVTFREDIKLEHVVKSINISYTSKEISINIQQPVAARETADIIKLASYHDIITVNLTSDLSLDFMIKSCIEHNMYLSYDANGAVCHQFVFKYRGYPDVTYDNGLTKN